MFPKCRKKVFIRCWMNFSSSVVDVFIKCSFSVRTCNQEIRFLFQKYSSRKHVFNNACVHVRAPAHRPRLHTSFLFCGNARLRPTSSVVLRSLKPIRIEQPTKGSYSYPVQTPITPTVHRWPPGRRVVIRRRPAIRRRPSVFQKKCVSVHCQLSVNQVQGCASSVHRVFTGFFRLSIGSQSGVNRVSIWDAQVFMSVAFFFPSPAHFRTLFLCLGVFSWHLVVFEAPPGPSDVHVRALGLWTRNAGIGPQSTMTLHKPSCRRKLFDDRQILAKRHLKLCHRPKGVVVRAKCLPLGPVRRMSRALLKSSTQLPLKYDREDVEAASRSGQHGWSGTHWTRCRRWCDECQRSRRWAWT